MELLFYPMWVERRNTKLWAKPRTDLEGNDTREGLPLPVEPGADSNNVDLRRGHLHGLPKAHTCHKSHELRVVVFSCFEHCEILEKAPNAQIHRRRAINLRSIRRTPLRGVRCNR